MKHTLIILFLVVAAPCAAQWKTAAYNNQILAFGVHDTNLFVSSNGSVDRYAPWQGAFQWVESDGGIDFTQGNVTSFASLGNYFFAGGTINGGPGAAYRSTDNGSSWILNASGPVATNGTYLFGCSATTTYRSRDSGNMWLPVAVRSANSYAAIGAYIFASTPNGTWRSIDSGANWTQISPPFTGTMTVMGSLIFMADTGSVALSKDSGTKWQAVPVDTAGEYERVAVLVTDGKNLFAGTGNGVLGLTRCGRTAGTTAASKGCRLELFSRSACSIHCFLLSSAGFPRSALHGRASDFGDDKARFDIQRGCNCRSSESLSINRISRIGQLVTIIILPAALSIYGVSVLNILGLNVLEVQNTYSLKWPSIFPNSLREPILCESKLTTELFSKKSNLKNEILYSFFRTGTFHPCIFAGHDQSL